MTKGESSTPARDEVVAGTGVYHGRRKRVRRRNHSAVVASFLAFLWPGLGHAYAHRAVRALLYAIPAAVLVLGGLAIVAQDPGTFAINLLAPSFALAIIGLLAIHALWRIAAIVDTWRTTRPGGPALTDRTLPLVVLLSLVVLVAHVGAGAVVQSFSDAGARIFTSDKPSGPGQIDEILGGPRTSGDPTINIDVNNDGVVDQRDDINGDGLINGDDIDAGDINGDGVVNEDDIVDGGEPIEGDTNGDGVVDEEDVPDPGASPGPSFDPSLTPPPLGPEPTLAPSVAPTPIAPGPGDGPPGSVPGEGPINVLFVGLDSGFGRGHSLSDTLIVASYYPSRDKVTMISIPRDTGRLPLYKGGVYRNRVNTFLGYAGRHPELFPEGPVAALMREVGYLLGTTIHYYAATNLEGMPPAVDAVGGVDITVTKAIHSEKSNYHLEPGTYHFNGVEAMQYARVRYGSSDFARARRQQQVIKALAVRVRDPSVAVRLPEVINALSDLVRTNVPRDQIPTLVRILDRANDASTENIVLSPVAGYARRVSGIGYYMIELNIAAVRELSIRVFGSYSRYR